MRAGRFRCGTPQNTPGEWWTSRTPGHSVAPGPVTAGRDTAVGLSPRRRPSWSWSTVNKADLVKELEKRLGSRRAANDALEAVLDTIVREVVRGGKVSITGFGTFDRVERAARTGRNPHTGTSVRIP